MTRSKPRHQNIRNTNLGHISIILIDDGQFGRYWLYLIYLSLTIIAAHEKTTHAAHKLAVAPRRHLRRGESHADTSTEEEEGIRR